jgi:hypothetical protein
MDAYGGSIAPDGKSGTFTSGNATIKISVGTSPDLTPEQIRELVEKIRRRLRDQAG